MWHQFQHSGGIKSCVISRLAARHRTTGSVGDRPRSGAPRVMDRNDDLWTYALRHCYATATQLQACLPEVRGTRVSRQTIRNRLHRFGLNARRPLQVTPLTPRHRRDRLQWAQDHVTWTMQQWIQRIHRLYVICSRKKVSSEIKLLFHCVYLVP
uniref:Transposase Tc1-like domain-containing protein n=1 Tax=Amphiprion percula TaxID=161767 RepID=A0A3P8RWC5_AMPPE